MSHTKTHLRRGAFAALACLTLLGSGCLPGVAWLPDSSGFIYMTGGDNMVTRDALKADKARLEADLRLAQFRLQRYEALEAETQRLRALRGRLRQLRQLRQSRRKQRAVGVGLAKME